MARGRDRVVTQLAAETSCLSLCWAVLGLLAGSLPLRLEHRELAQMRALERLMGAGGGLLPKEVTDNELSR